MSWDELDPCGAEVAAPSATAGVCTGMSSSPPPSPGARNGSSAVPTCWEDWQDAEEETCCQDKWRACLKEETEEPCAPAGPTDAPHQSAPSSPPAEPTPVSPGPAVGGPLGAPATLDAATRQYIADHGLEVLELSRDKCLGKGAFGRAYLVQVPLPDGSRIPAVLKRMRATTSPAVVAAEVEALSRLRGCGGCVQLLAHGEHNLRQALLLEYCPGGALADRLEKSARRQGILKSRLLMRAPALRKLAVQLFQALADVHAVGLIHQDIKPDNLLYDKSGDLQIADFGTAAVLLDNGQYNTRGAGSMLYMAPELETSMSNRPTHPITDKADVYSAGATLLDAAWLYDSAGQHWSFTHGTPITIPKFMPVSLLAFLRQLLHEDPLQRPTAQQALESAWVTGCDE